MSDLINVPAPDFSIPWLDGGQLTLSENLRGLTLLVFWSAECPWSRRADVVLVYRKMQWERGGLQVIGIASNPDEPPTEIRYELGIRQVTYPIAIDSYQTAATLYGIEYTPHFFLIDSQGIIRYNGALDDATYQQRLPKTIYLDEAVAALMRNRTPQPQVTTAYGSALNRLTSAE